MMQDSSVNVGKGWEGVLVLTGLGLGLYYVTFAILGVDFAYFPGDLGDARFNMYLLEHAHRYFTGGVSAFWDAPFMFPESQVISYSDNLLGTAPFYTSFRLMGLDVISAFQSWYVLMAVLSFLTCYFYLRWLTKNPVAAVIGAWVFAFSLSLQSQMTHAQTFPRFPIPLAFWLVMLFERDLKPGYFLATACMVVYQFYCAVYLGFLLAVPIGIYLLVVVISQWQTIRKRIAEKHWGLRMSGSLLLSMLLLLPLMLPYLVRAGTVESYGYSGVVGNLPTLSSHYFSKSGSLLWDVLSHHGTGLPAWWDHQLFAGGIATVCLLLFWSKEVASVFRKGWQTWSPTRSLFVVSLLTFLCYLRVGEASIYRLLFELPGFGSIRALARIINIELIFFAVATAIVVSHLYRIPKWGLLASLLLLGGVVFDNYLPVGKAYRTLKEDAESRTEFLVAKLNDLAPGTVISYEPDSISEPAAFIQLDAMMASQALALKCLNGYSATAPVGFSFYWDRPNPETRMRWLKQKKAEDLQIEVIR